MINFYFIIISVYNNIRKKILLEDIEKDEKEIKRLSKKLNLNRVLKKDNKSLKTPVWLKKYGLDCMLCYLT